MFNLIHFRSSIFSKELLSIVLPHPVFVQLIISA